MTVRDYLKALVPGSPSTPDLVRTLAEGLPAMVVLSEEGKVTFVNSAGRTMTGLKDEDLLGLPVLDLVHPEHRGLLRPHTPRQAPSPSRLEVKLVQKQGRDVWVELTRSRARIGETWTDVWTALDITGRRLAEGAARETERRFRDLLEGVQLVCAILDVAGLVSFANTYLLELAAVDEEDVIGRSFFEVFLPEESRERARRVFAERMASGAIAPHEEGELLTRHGEKRTLYWDSTLLRGPRGEVTGVVLVGADATEKRHAEARLLHGTLYDLLTGLPNRALFMDRLSTALGRSRRGPTQCAVLLLDLDRFKLVNETLGPRLGDQVIVEVSRALSSLVRPGDTVARLGGDEFALLLDGIASLDEATEIARNILTALDRPIGLGSQRVTASASIGISLSGEGYDDAFDMLRDADTAMYQAKAGGRGRYKTFEPSMRSEAVGLFRLESSLRRAAHDQEFVLHYQPVVELGSGAIVGLEALARWDHPQRGLIDPDEWIHLAEEAGLIHQLGRWALAEACATLRSWEDLLPPSFSVSVNLSRRQFSEADLVEDVAAVLRSTGLAPRRLKLEVTESALFENAETAVRVLGRLREAGIGVAIDDFGTGYSSLSYLLRLPADLLKIDRSFVAEMDRSERGVQVVSAIVSLGRGLGLEVVAEGVESEEQRRKLVALGCSLGQGYLFSKPLAPLEARGLLEAARDGEPRLPKRPRSSLP
jgi:diguanylate cyclase (GGDEF)-like protein/PAS domain S-box-containing protein